MKGASGQPAAFFFWGVDVGGGLGGDGERPDTCTSFVMPAKAGMTKEMNGVSPSNPVTPDLIRNDIADELRELTILSQSAKVRHNGFDRSDQLK